MFCFGWQLNGVFNMYITDVTATLTDIILTSISQKSNLLDSFVITYATIVASLYRLIGIEFGKQNLKGLN